MHVKGALLIPVLAISAAIGCSPNRPAYVPRDPVLQHLPVYFYPHRSAGPARAVIFFFGNDVGFWDPHRELSDYLAGQSYAVVGFDMRAFLAALPEGIPARDSAFRARILPLIASARHEIHADSLPLIIVGHSLGSEVAIWTAAFAKPPGTVGVIAMSPGLRSHLRISVSDLINGPEPEEEGSFSVPGTLRQIQPDIRVAIVRGDHDKYRYADPALIKAGGNRIHAYIVPFASHSLKRIIVARPVMRQALDWLLEPVAVHATAGKRTTIFAETSPGK